MKDFIFDLQRFNTDWVVVDGSGSIVAKSVETDKVFNSVPSGGAIYLIRGGSNSSAKDIPSDKSFTINLSGYDSTSSSASNNHYSWTPWSNGGTYKIPSGTNVTIQNGTLSIANSGGFSVASDGSLSLMGGHDNNGDHSLTVNIAESKSFSYNGTTYTASKGAANLIYYGTNDSNTSIQGSSFTIADSNNSSVSYTASVGGLSASYKDENNTTVTKYHVGEANISQSGSTYIYTSKLNELSTASMVSGYLVSGNSNTGDTITISSSALSSLAGGESYYILSASKYSSIYGTIKKDGSGNYTLGAASDEHKQNATLGAITIGDTSSTVVVDSSTFHGVKIAMDGMATFTSEQESGNFTVKKTTDNFVSVAGSSSLNLVSGSIKTDQNTQSITADSYTISGYSGGNNGNGIIVMGSGSNISVADIDEGESFTVTTSEGGKVYTYKKNFGIVADNSLIYAGGFSIVENAYTIDLSGALKPPIAPDSKLLVLGGNHSQSAVVVDNENNFTVKYADLNVEGNNYTLTTITGDSDSTNFSKYVSTISVGGGNTTIDSVLGVNKTIRTADESSFIVTATSLSAFNLDGTVTAPTIGGATAFKLLESSSITATENQTVTFGNSDNDTFTFAGGSNISISTDSNNVYTVNAGKSNAVSLAGGDYSLASNSDGMTFIGSSGNITLGGLDSTTDVFTHGEATYSVTGVGFIQTTSDRFKIYNVTENHSLEGGSITASALDGPDVWSRVLSVSSGAVTIPSDFNTGSAVILDTSNFKTNYGSVTASDDGKSYTLTHSNSGLSAVSLHSGATNLSLSSAGTLPDMQISAGFATLKVKDDSTAGYDVALSDSAASVTGASTVTLTSGKAELDSTTPYYVGSTAISASGGAVIGLEVSDNETTISGLSSGEIFTVGNTIYTLLGNGRFKNSDGKLWKADSIATDNTGSVALNSLTSTDNWYSVAQATLSGDTLTLGDNTFSALSSVPVYVIDQEDYGTIFGTLEKSGQSYALTDADSTNNSYSTLLINSQKTISIATELAGKTIKAGESTSTFQVTNDDGDGFTLYYTNNVVSVDGASALTLTDGSIVAASTQVVKLGDGDELNFGGNNLSISSASSVFTVNANASNEISIGSQSYTIDSNSDGMTFIESGSGNITLGGLGTTNKDAFIYGGESYSVRGVGFVKQTGDSVYSIYNVSGTHSLSNASIAAGDLDGENWSTVHNAPNGAVTIPSILSDSVVIVDTNNFNKTYGTLTNDGGTFVLKLASIDTTLSSITIPEKVKVELPYDLAGKSIAIDATNNATFSINATKNFTIDTTGTYPSISDADSVTLSAGTLYAAVGTPITVNSHEVTATKISGYLTVGINDTGAFIGELNTGETLTIDGIAYEMTAAGLYDAKNNKLVPTSEIVNGTYDLSDPYDIIAVDGTTLDLTKQNDDALVYDSIKNPTTFLATFKVDSTLSLTGESGAAANIKTVKIAANKNFDVDFATTVEMPKGNAAINGVNYDAQSKLVLDSDGETSTLYSGTVKLDSGTPTVTATNNPELATLNGNFNATAAKGSLTRLTNLDAGDSFSYGGTTYTQSAIGLVTGSTLAESLKGSSVSIDDIASATFADIIAADNGVLNLSTAKTAIVVDSLTNPTKKYGNITVSDGTYNLDFAIDATASGNVTVNGQNYAASGTITLTTTAETSTLYEGTVNLAAGDSVTADKTLTAVSGSVTATAKAGKFVTVDGLDAGESFTYDGKTYTQTTMGLTTDDSICTDLAGTSIELSKLSSANWTGFIVPEDGVIDLSSVKRTSAVFDDLINPTTQLGTLTKNGTTYTADFAVKLTASGTVTVNGKSYDADGTITLTTTAATSTLTNGTVNLSDAESVTTTSNGTVTATKGDISVNVGSTLTIGKLNAGDTFTIDGTEYSLTAAGLFKDKNYLCTEKISSTVTLDTLKSDVWSPIVTISNGELDVNSKLGTGLVVSDDYTKIYGTLSKSSGVYTLGTASTANATLSSISADGIKLQIAPDFVDVPLSSANAKFSDLALTTGQENFTLDDTGNVAVLTNVKSFTLDEGVATISEGQIATTGSNTVTATTGNFTLDALSLAAIDSGDVFKLNGTTYTMKTLGLFSGNKFVTGGFSGNTLTFADLELSPLIAPAEGVINLANVKETSAVVDDLTNPTTLLGTLTKDGTTYTTNFATNLTASGTVTVNDKTYTADGSITVNTTVGSSTLKSGTVKLTAEQSVTTASGDMVAATNGDLNVTATDSAVKISSFDKGDEFTLNGDIYKISAVGPINPEGKLWTGKAFASGLTTEELADAGNWKTMLVVDGDLYIDDALLANGDDVVLVDDDPNPTKIYGTLEKSGGEYTLTDDSATTTPDSITIDKAVVNIENPLSTVEITTISTDGTESTFTVKPSGESETFLVDSKKSTTLVDRVTEIDIDKGKIQGGDGTIVKPNEGSENVSILLDNGKHTVGDENLTIEGLEEDSTIEAKVDSDGNITDFVGMEEGSTITINGTTYTAPEDDSTLHYTETDGWYFDDYELDAYTVTVEKKGTVTVDPGVKFSNVVGSGMQSNGTVEISADLDDVPVTVVNTSKSALTVTDEDGTLIESLDRDSTATVQRKIDEIVITADAGNSMTLTAEDYIFNGVEMTTSGSTKVTATTNGVEIDLSNGTTVTFDEKTISGTGTVTLSADGNILAEGTVKIDDVTFTSDEPFDTSIASGISVTGDTNGYQVNVKDGKIVGLEGIAGNATVTGVDNATVKTDGTGTFTADKTFTADSGTTYTITNGKITAAEVPDTIGGDFSGGVTVNDNPVTVQGGNATVSADGDIQTAAGTYTVNGHAFTASTAPTFSTEDGKVTGVEIESGNLVVNQNETDFKVNDETLTLANNSTPVSLGIADGNVTSASGVNGSIDGLEDATVYDAGKATINGKKLDVSGTCAAVVVDGEAAGLVGVESGATINSAPDMTIEIESGDYTIGGANYSITDTVDGTCKIETNDSTGVSDIENFAGSISGAVGAVTLNGKNFGTNDGAVTVSSDGENITGVHGVKSGDSIGGDLDAVSFTLPEGTVTINDNALKLEGVDSAEVSNGGKAITGLTKDASLSASQSGTYRVNGRSFSSRTAASFTVNRDGAYKINDNYLPIIETTPGSLVTERGYTIKDSNGTVSGDNIAVRGNANVTVPVDNTNIIATSGSVTLQNYSENATIQTYEYTNLGNAILNNLIQFGNGIMTLGDAVITYTENASSTGSTINKLLNAVGSDLLMGFTHVAGGKIDLSSRTEAALLKGNYAGKSGDTQKSGASDLKTGDGNDTLLIGGGDSVDAGAGSNTIYITDSRLREAAATIYLNQGTTRVTNFNGGFTDKSDRVVVSDVTDLSFSYTNTQFVITSGGAQMLLYNLASSSDLVTSADMTDNSYKFKLGEGSKTYNTAVAKDGGDITVNDSEAAVLYYGNDSGVSFSEYTGAVRVNLSEGTGALKGTSAQFHGINKLEGGKGNSTLNGAAGVQNTLIAGTGDGSLWSNAGADLMVGKTNKSGTTTFYFLADDGRDTITGFDFATSADATGDFIDITKANEVTDVWLEGSDVVMQINESSYDYLTLVGAKGKNFRINNLMAKVDENLSYDGNVNCYVAMAGNATLSVDSNVGDSDIWLNDNVTGLHGKYYLGDIQYIDATRANGSNILAGNALDNVIYGGKVANSLWGGVGLSQDTLVGGKGQNTFYFGAYNGNDIVQNANDGDIVDLTTLKLIEIAATTITAGGAVVEVVDGSKIEVQSNASIEYRLLDGTYTANHTTGEWIKK